MQNALFKVKTPDGVERTVHHDMGIMQVKKIYPAESRVIAIKSKRPLRRMMAQEIQMINQWLDEIEEYDPDIRAGTIERCECDAEAREYFLLRAGARLKNIQRTADINPGSDVMVRITIQGLENQLKYLDRIVNCEAHLMAARTTYHAAVTELEHQQQVIQSVMYPAWRRPDLKRAEQTVKNARQEYYQAYRWFCECQAQIIIADHASVFAAASLFAGDGNYCKTPVSAWAVEQAKKEVSEFLTIEGGI